MHRRISNLCNNSVYSGGSCLLNAIVGAVSSSTALTSRGCCTGVWESTARLLRLVDSIQAKRRGGSSRQPARASRWSAPGQASGWRGHPGCRAWGGIQEAHRAGAGVAGGVGALLCTGQPRCDGAHEIHGGARGGVIGIERVCEEGRRGCGARNPRLTDCTDRWCAYQIR